MHGDGQAHGPCVASVGGSRIKELREESTAHISVATDTLPQSNERLVTIMGDAESIGKAITAIVDILHKTEIMAPLYLSVRTFVCSCTHTTAPRYVGYIGTGQFMP